MKENSMGKKIRALRLEKGMTQAALAGDTVTRNMLSQIENGNAQPSVATILDLAEKLGAPPEYFFSECGDLNVFRKIGAIEKIRKAFGDGEYGKCIYRLDHLGVSDEETEYLWAESYFAMGVSLYREGKLRSAAEKLEKALLHAKKTNYVSEGLLCAIRRYEAAIGFVRDKDAGEMQAIPEELRGCMADLDYVTALSGGFSSRRCREGDFYARHLDLRERMRGCEDTDGLQALAEELQALIEELEGKRYAVLRYYALGDAEEIARRQGDYKRAYECASARLEISEKMNV